MKHTENLWRLALVGGASICAVVLLRCPNDSVVRDEQVYQAEAAYMEQAALQTAEHLIKLVKAHCECKDDKLVTEDCRAAADVALVASTRAGWHKSMMLYNAGLLKERPSKEPPEIPPADSLCGERP